MKIKVACFSSTLALIYGSTRRNAPGDRYLPIYFYVMKKENSAQKTKPIDGDFGEESYKPTVMSSRPT